MILLSLFNALYVRKFFFSLIILDGSSIEVTLHNQYKMIVNKFIYSIKEPERFDIVIFHANEQKDFIKRVIGLPGEHVKVEDNILYIDGEEIAQSFLKPDEQSEIVYPIFTNDFTLERLKGNYDVIPDNHVLE